MLEREKERRRDKAVHLRTVLFSLCESLRHLCASAVKEILRD
jgi:hypothetical protein